MRSPLDSNPGKKQRDNTVNNASSDLYTTNKSSEKEQMEEVTQTSIESDKDASQPILPNPDQEE